MAMFSFPVIFKFGMSDCYEITTDAEKASLEKAGYKFIRKISEGAFSDVHLVKFLKSERKETFLACKTVDSSRAGHEFKSRFLNRELFVLKNCQHPNIIKIHSIFQRNDKYFIFMLFAQRGDLFDYLIDHGALKEPQCITWTRQIAAAIQYLHTMNIAHRDLKCENILIMENNDVKLADFGFAKLNCEKAILSETFCGSIYYAAPEVLNQKPYDPKCADMWSFGIIIYSMLEKQFPFDTSRLSKLYENQMTSNWKFGKKSSLYSEQVKYVLKSLLEPLPIHRWTIANLLDSEWIRSHFRDEDILTN